MPRGEHFDAGDGAEAVGRLRNGDITRNKHGENPRSDEAYRANKDKWATGREEVRLFAISQGALGITADEIKRHFSAYSHNSHAPRCSELLRDGILVRNGKTRKTKSGRKADVFVIREVMMDRL